MQEKPFSICYLLRPYHASRRFWDRYSSRIIRRSCHNLSGFACRLIVITPSRQGPGPGYEWPLRLIRGCQHQQVAGPRARTGSHSSNRRHAATGEKISRNELSEPGAWAAWAGPGHHTQTPAGWISGAGHVRLDTGHFITYHSSLSRSHVKFLLSLILLPSDTNYKSLLEQS